MTIADGQLSRTGHYIAGQRFTVADIALGVVIHRWFALKIKRPELANIAAYYQRLTERPAYRVHVNNDLP